MHIEFPRRLQSDKRSKFEAGGKPSTWFTPGELAKLRQIEEKIKLCKKYKHKHNNKIKKKNFRLLWNHLLKALSITLRANSFMK